MIKAIVGAGGSGKSLHFIRYLFETVEVVEIEIVNDKEKEVVVKRPLHRLYGRLIINIKGFNVNLFRELSGNLDIEIIHESKHWHKDDIERIFKEQEKEDKKDENDRVPTLLIYDECQFGLSTFSQASNALEQNEYIANFMSLHRHYGPCDIFLATQSKGKINSKFVGDLDELFISLESSQKLDPENDIVFDQYDKEGKAIITGGRSKIKFKKLDEITADNGEKFLPFKLYTSGDAGRRPVKSKSFWGKYIWILLLLVFFIFFGAFMVFYNLFTKMDESANSIVKKSEYEAPPSYKPPSSLPIVDEIIEEEKITQFDRYLETPYHNIDAQVLYRIFINKNNCFIGKQVITVNALKQLLEDNVIYKLSEQVITRNSMYINVLIHQSLLNSYQLMNDFDVTAENKANGNSSDKGVSF